MSKTRHTSRDEPHFLIRTLGVWIRTAAATSRHTHDWGQFIYCSAGVMTVWTEQGSWVAPPHWAIWVPAGVSHEIRFAGAAALRTLYLRDDLAATLPPHCAVVTVSPLLRELVLRAVDLGMLDERSRSHIAMANLIVDEATAGDRPPLQLPAPISPAAKRAADLLSAGGTVRTANLALRVGLSTRTLERRFIKETGMTVAAWGRQARLLNSLRLLAGGNSVKSAAEVGGYSSASAFVAAFRAAFGQTPSRYFTHVPALTCPPARLP